MVTTARTINLALIEFVPELVLSGNKRQGGGESCIIRSFTFFAAIKWMRRSWAGHLARTGIIRYLHRIIVGRTKKETVSEGMALFGSVVTGQRQAFRDVAEADAFFEHPNCINFAK
jgi:hypothetical protein